MKMNEIIEKYGLKLATQNGVIGITSHKKITTAAIALIKSNRDEIIAELQAQEETKALEREKWLKEKAEKEDAEKRRVEELIESGQALLSFVCDDTSGEFSTISYVVSKEREYEGKKCYEEIKRLEKIEHGWIVRNTFDFKQKFFDGYGDRTNRFVYFISKSEAKQISDINAGEIQRIEENKKAREVAKELKAKRVEELKAEAVRTGEKIEIENYSEDCNDKNEDCDVDIVVVYAMPDGTIKKERHHTW